MFYINTLLTYTGGKLPEMSDQCETVGVQESSPPERLRDEEETGG